MEDQSTGMSLLYFLRCN